MSFRRLFVCLSVCLSVNLSVCKYFLLSQLLHYHWMDIFETWSEYSPQCLLVQVPKTFRSVDKPGRRRPSLIFLVRLILMHNIQWNWTQVIQHYEVFSLNTTRQYKWYSDQNISFFSFKLSKNVRQNLFCHTCRS